MEENSRIPRVSGCHALDVGCCGGDAVERLAGFNFGDHLAHVEIDFARVFGEAVESYCFALAKLGLKVEEEKGKEGGGRGMGKGDVQIER
jgi:hypothetical protein